MTRANSLSAIGPNRDRSEEHTSELQSQSNLVCRLLLEKKKHLHLHLHPAVFGILMANAELWGIRQFRLTRDPFWFNAGLASGQRSYRSRHALIYQWRAG